VARRSGSRGGAWSTAAAIALGIAGWAAMVDSGVHATLAGVLFAAAVPVRPEGSALPLSERLEHALHPWTSRVVLPLFALANAGVLISLPSDVRGGRVAFGVAVGLVVGKCLGVGGGAWVATRLRFAQVPEGVTWPQMFAVATIAGIGFTVSLFIAGLAFEDPNLEDAAKLGIVLGSIVAATLGGLALRLTGPSDGPPGRLPATSPGGR
ncbi:MAG: Na+/H+ antiporter NhaA, partial [Actinomycetota bacterium]|nr:Na+/H+ antiporter NhaA [Actinomycetota bacterium]